METNLIKKYVQNIRICPVSFYIIGPLKIKVLLRGKFKGKDYMQINIEEFR